MEDLFLLYIFVEYMTTLTRFQRVFDTVFPPSESPFLAGYVHTEVLRPEQQRLWDVVTGILGPDFSQPFDERNDITAGELHYLFVLTLSLVK